MKIETTTIWGEVDIPLKGEEAVHVLAKLKAVSPNLCVLALKEGKEVRVPLHSLVLLTKPPARLPKGYASFLAGVRFI